MAFNPYGPTGPFAQGSSPAPAAVQQGHERYRRPVAMPSNIRVLDDGAIERRWLTASAFGLLLFCLLWDGSIAFTYVSISKSGASGLVFLLPFFHALCGVFITYATIAKFVNRTTIAIADGVLAIKHGPLPWSAPAPIPIDQLDQLYCGVERSKDTRWYPLMALLRDGRQIKLLDDLRSPDQAQYLEQLLEQRLGILDYAMPGEFAGGEGDD